MCGDVVRTGVCGCAQVCVSDMAEAGTTQPNSPCQQHTGIPRAQQTNGSKASTSGRDQQKSSHMSARRGDAFGTKHCVISKGHHIPRPCLVLVGRSQIHTRTYADICTDTQTRTPVCCWPVPRPLVPHPGPQRNQLTGPRRSTAPASGRQSWRSKRG